MAVKIQMRGDTAANWATANLWAMLMPPDFALQPCVFSMLRKFWRGRIRERVRQYRKPRTGPPIFRR